jgi:hypothetical protein
VGTICVMAALATVAPGATVIADTMSGKTRQQMSEATNTMLRMSASLRAAPEWRQRQNEPLAARLQTQSSTGGRVKFRTHAQKLES